MARGGRCFIGRHHPGPSALPRTLLQEPAVAYARCQNHPSSLARSTRLAGQDRSKESGSLSDAVYHLIFSEVGSAKMGRGMGWWGGVFRHQLTPIMWKVAAVIQLCRACSVLPCPALFITLDNWPPKILDPMHVSYHSSGILYLTL